MRKKPGGFTLIELLIVIPIIGILAADFNQDIVYTNGGFPQRPEATQQ